ncbi:glycosyltransferase family 8 protein [Salegentibacter mishustinae]|uniref:glycosyltransferase family 8 protein n=1 Tax=Salegentibacter mishustinae TaxID=270918 RepID=UPI002492340F|nr:glycosyltransferase family 8 protein [Salegentibacter mishustinae]
MEKINIVTYADGLYLQHACIMLMSLRDVVSKDREYEVYIFYSNSTRNDLEKAKTSLSNFLPENVCFNLLECDFGLASKIKAKREYLNASIYDKILIYEHLPPNVNKVVFFDADIVLQKDPAFLFDLDLEGNYLAAVLDQVFESFSEESKKVLGIGGNQYFNTGVMLVDVERWRTDKISERSLKFAKEKWDKTPFHDQDAFNFVIKGKWKEISPLWNPRISNRIINSEGNEEVYSKMEVYDKNLSYLIHYSGSQKPWIYMSFHPRKKEYLAYLRLSEFKDYQFPDYNLANFLKKQIINLRRNIYFIRKGK